MGPSLHRVRSPLSWRYNWDGRIVIYLAWSFQFTRLTYKGWVGGTELQSPILDGNIKTSQEFRFCVISMWGWPEVYYILRKFYCHRNPGASRQSLDQSSSFSDNGLLTLRSPERTCFPMLTWEVAVVGKLHGKSLRGAGAEPWAARLGCHQHRESLLFLLQWPPCVVPILPFSQLAFAWQFSYSLHHCLLGILGQIACALAFGPWPAPTRLLRGAPHSEILDLEVDEPTSSAFTCSRAVVFIYLFPQFWPRPWDIVILYPIFVQWGSNWSDV